MDFIFVDSFLNLKEMNSILFEDKILFETPVIFYIQVSWFLYFLSVGQELNTLKPTNKNVYIAQTLVRGRE